MYDRGVPQSPFFLMNLSEFSCNPDIFVLYYIQHIKEYAMITLI